MAASSRPMATPTVQIDNDTVRVTEWRFSPGATTGFHRHEYDYVVVPMTTGRLRIFSAGGESSGTETTGELATGQAYFRSAGVEHEVINDNPFEIVFVETEVKGMA
jgi:quercetin dioxygenase-like cupin family protein